LRHWIRRRGTTILPNEVSLAHQRVSRDREDDATRHVDAWLAGVDDTDLAISALTVREVSKGIARLRTSPNVAAAIAARVTDVFDALDGRILPVDRSVAEVWGELLAVMEKHIDDAGLAATARSHGLVLVTRNTKNFARRGVSLLNPYKSPSERLA
jgi:predicted nucleic acid-binding protein